MTRRIGPRPYFPRVAGATISAGVFLAVVVAVLPRDGDRRAYVGAVLLSLLAAAFFGAVGWLGLVLLVERRNQRRGDARRAAGLCERCGYDVRGIDEKCPECGMPIWRPWSPSTTATGSGGPGST